MNTELGGKDLFVSNSLCFRWNRNLFLRFFVVLQYNCFWWKLNLIQNQNNNNLVKKMS